MQVFRVSERGELPTALVQARPQWLVVYATEDVPLDGTLRALREAHPEVPVIGATSFQGVFSPEGFGRGMAILAGEADDGLHMASAGAACDEGDARQRAAAAAQHIEQALGGAPQVLLMHATPGFEEAILAGVADALPTGVPVYGGSAADDGVAGRWRVFNHEGVHAQGFVLAGFGGQARMHGAFLAGYLPTEHSGRVTRSEGRIVYEIDGRPAAHVYDEWTGGRISDALGGGTVLASTTMAPVARVISNTHAMPRRLLSHPFEVMAEGGALHFFSEFEQGDEITLMTCTEEQLVTRVDRTIERARPQRGRRPAGGLFVYCGGSLGEVLDRAEDIASRMRRGLGNAPFVGVATFGEQGWFFDRRESRHGNLMCSTILFDR